MENRDRVTSYVGRYFGNYCVESRIACGAFSCVYLAQNDWLGRSAAIKLLHSAFLQFPRERRRFLREARFLEALRHPHILEIYDCGIDHGLPYLITEYAPNGSLSELLTRRSPRLLSVQRAISIVTQVGEGLHYANQQNILHLDIKPANILFNSNNQALLADFGISVVQTKFMATYPTVMLGTPEYMAPEQFLGKIGQRSDQYSLGCITYQLFTGRLPFTAPNAIALGRKHVYQPPIPPSHWNPNIPPSVEYAILKAMAKDCMDRFETVADFVRALQ